MKRWLIPILVLGLIVSGMYAAGFFRAKSQPVGESSPAGHSSSVDRDEAPANVTDESEAAPLPETRGTILVRVVDDRGRAIEGAVLHLRSARSDDATGPRGATPLLEDRSGRNVTSSDGRARYSELDRDLRYSLMVRATDRVGVRRRNLEATGEEIEVVLAPGETVRGVVVDPSYRIVPDAIVLAAGEVTDLAVGAGPPFDDTVVTPEVTTDSEGAFVLSGIPLGTFSITAFHEDWSPSEPLNLLEGVEEVTLVLRANTVVEGRVIDDRGVPIKGATVQSTRGAAAGTRSASAAVTDSEGVFRLEGLPPGALRLEARKNGYAKRTLDERDTLAEGETLIELEIVLDREARIFGVIVDPEGTPLAGAEVSLRRPGILQQVDGPRVTTEADGTFALVGVGTDPGESESVRLVRIEHSRYTVADSEEFAVAPAAQIDLGTITLTDPVVIAGRVLDADHRPLADASVELLAIDDGSGGDTVVMELFGTAMPVRMFQAARGRTKSDLDGHYELKVKDPGDYRVAATAAGFQRIESDPVPVADRSVEGVDVHLPVALRIEGDIVDELGLPCEGVVVRAAAEGRSHDSEKSDLDGRFVVDGLGPGAYRLSLIGEGWSLAEEAAEVEAGVRGVSLLATRPGQIVGRVVDHNTGRPVTQFSVKIERDDNPQNNVIFFGGSGGDGVEFQDPDGRFQLDGIGPGRHRLTVRARGWVENSETAEVTSGTTTEVGIDLELAGVIVGRVVDPTGRPIPEVRVSYQQLGEGAKRRSRPGISISFASSGGQFVVGDNGPPAVVTDDDGRFRLEGIDDGEIRVRFRHGAFRPATEEPVAARRGIETDLGTIELSRGSTVSGRVRGEGGARLTWSNVVVRSAAGTVRSAQVNRDGEFELGGLEAGSYSITVNYILARSTSTGAERRQHDGGSVELGTDDNRTVDLIVPRE